MGLFTHLMGDPAEVAITPGSLAKPPADVHAAKLRNALAFLGDKWCLAATRAEQLQRLKDGKDLI